ncbi:ATP-binding cassette domain-containing protein [Aquihabitans sp. McL0605]|uniref:ABC transporter ATP-binding protein n=1 Tax=Aquihabitans sp. McL0605 TaxID=3415671 RepID=UPI003CE9044D
MVKAVQTQGLSKHYGHTKALDGLDLEIEPGEVFGYLGPNGAGKSTTLSLLLGTIRPTAGSAQVFGHDVWRDATELHGRMAYVPSVASLWPSLTGAETLRFLGSIHGSVDEAYRDELIDRFELIVDKKVRAYSHGNHQKVVLIAAFACRADLLLLDEPTTGLDPLMEQVFRQCVREARQRGQTVLLSSHILSEVEAVCDRVAMLRGGRIIETGQLEVLRGLAAMHVRAVVSGPPPSAASLEALDGVTAVDVDGQSIECQVVGSMEPLLGLLVPAGVQHLTTREPSLEELFMSHYGGAASAAGADGQADPAVVRAAGDPEGARS